MKFEIYYTGDTIVRGEGVEQWRKAPSTGVQVIVAIYENGAQEKLYGFDEYTYDPKTKTLYGDDRKLPGMVKLGELISDEEYANIKDSLEDWSQLWNS